VRLNFGKCAHTIVRRICRDLGRHHRSSECTGLSIPSAPATVEDAAGTATPATTSMPRQRLRSIPRESPNRRVGINCHRTPKPDRSTSHRLSDRVSANTIHDRGTTDERTTLIESVTSIHHGPLLFHASCLLQIEPHRRRNHIASITSVASGYGHYRAPQDHLLLCHSRQL
jgi:hypothetical protein